MLRSNNKCVDEDLGNANNFRRIDKLPSSLGSAFYDRFDCMMLPPNGFIKKLFSSWNSPIVKNSDKIISAMILPLSKLNSDEPKMCRFKQSADYLESILFDIQRFCQLCDRPDEFLNLKNVSYISYYY